MADHTAKSPVAVTNAYARAFPSVSSGFVAVGGPVTLNVSWKRAPPNCRGTTSHVVRTNAHCVAAMIHVSRWETQKSLNLDTRDGLNPRKQRRVKFENSRNSTIDDEKTALLSSDEEERR
ncbi:hypothetical protein PsorP6_009387 [Peronosclerospora sorghi]|uniref:Uncharacterized protein n=1 Tax=Peronosclerospora sorghi TaxID=230839 RepID=A0ACC0W2T4_9STRA|nr:hypothetical protein PsorP6_009387 [Peronosclerospora sorghi]